MVALGPDMSNWYRLDAAEVLRLLESDADHGLSQAEVTERVAQHGLNQLVEQQGESPWQILWEQLTATVVVVLIVAAVLSALLGEFKDAAAILAIVGFNTLLGFRQEYQAGRAIAALKQLAIPTVKTRRDDRIRQISARELVPGDLVLLEAGSLVPADCRLLESINLRVQEASLTGESEPTTKQVMPLTGANLPVADRSNMAYMGTLVTYGRGMAVVTDTGMDTELGHIASAIQQMKREPTPLQQRLDQLGWVLAIAILVIVSIIFALGLARGEEWELMFLTAVSLAVAAVPEGLPAVVTIALALGAQRMLGQRALIRKLPAVETLGSVTVICSDKTGTLTENRMTVTCLDVAHQRLHLSAPSHPPSQAITSLAQPHLGGMMLDQQLPVLSLLLTGAALCNDALVQPESNDLRSLQVLGDPTEAALVLAAAELGLWKNALETLLPRIAEVPFDADRKRMTTLHYLAPRLTNEPEDFVLVTDTSLPDARAIVQHWHQAMGKMAGIAFVKGAVDGLLNVTTTVWVKDQPQPINDIWRHKIMTSHNQLAQSGLRVLGIAVRPLQILPDHPHGPTLEQDLVFVGMMGMIDLPRPEAREAVQICKNAGIRPVMITGDHPLTAQHIAHELGISSNGYMLTGQDLEQLSVAELANLVEEVPVYARVSPQHKLDIVQALQQRGHVVAMTGDGINDAPALKKADIGIAMGITGTDVAKEAADMVLLDDNFATIVAATREGRVIYDNVRKFIKYTLTGNCGELWVILLAPFLGMPLPLVPLQILWINLMADGLLALALGVEPAELNVMQRPPHKPNESIFARGVGRDITWIGLLLGLILLAIAYVYWSADDWGNGWFDLLDDDRWQTMVFTTLAFSRMGLAQAMRSDHESVFLMGLFTNRPLLAAVLFTFGMQLAVIFVPFLQEIFTTDTLSLLDLGLCLGLSSIVFWAIELEKWLQRRGHRSPPT